MYCIVLVTHHILKNYHYNTDKNPRDFVAKIVHIIIFFVFVIVITDKFLKLLKSVLK